VVNVVKNKTDKKGGGSALISQYILLLRWIFCPPDRSTRFKLLRKQVGVILVGRGLAKTLQSKSTRNRNGFTFDSHGVSLAPRYSLSLSHSLSERHITPTRRQTAA